MTSKKNEKKIDFGLYWNRLWERCSENEWVGVTAVLIAIVAGIAAVFGISVLIIALYRYNQVLGWGVTAAMILIPILTFFGSLMFREHPSDNNYHQEY